MKKINYKTVWIVGIFLTLITILLMVMTYKIKYEDAIFYKYLYFYNCDNKLCSTEKEEEIIDKSSIQSVYKYRNEKPSYIELGNGYLQINDNDEVVLYEYIKSKIITRKYLSYELLDTNKTYFIVKNKNDRYGIIDENANKTVDFTYQEIKKSYNDNMIVAVYNDIYGIITLDSHSAILNFEYQNLYIFDNIIVTIKDNKLSIIDTNKNKLTEDIDIVDVNTTTVVREENIINIKLKTKDGFSEYKFDLNSKKYI